MLLLLLGRPLLALLLLLLGRPLLALLLLPFLFLPNQVLMVALGSAQGCM